MNDITPVITGLASCCDSYIFRQQGIAVVPTFGQLCVTVIPTFLGSIGIV